MDRPVQFLSSLTIPDSCCVAPEELDRHCLERIARFKRPKQYHFIDALPKNSYGKVLKRELKDRLASGRDSTEKHT